MYIEFCTNQSILQNNQNKQNMDKFFLVSFLGMLITAHGVVGNMIYDHMVMLEELENLDIEEEKEVELSPIPSWTSERGSKVLVNVDSFGAFGDGVSDDTQVNLCSLETAMALIYHLFNCHPFSTKPMLKFKSAWQEVL